MESKNACGSKYDQTPFEGQQVVGKRQTSCCQMLTFLLNMLFCFVIDNICII